MKKVFLLFLLMIGVAGCGDNSDDSTPFIPPIVPTFPVKVDIASHDFPPESKNWKYAVSDNTSSFVKANYLVERLGKASAHESPDAYIAVHLHRNLYLYPDKLNNYIYIHIYSASKDKRLYYAGFEPAKNDSPATLYNSIVEFAIDSIKTYPQDSFSGVVELPY